MFHRKLAFRLTQKFKNLKKNGELTGTLADVGVFNITSRRKFKQLSLLNTQALALWVPIMCLLNDVAQALRVTLLDLRGCITTLLGGYVCLPRREVQTRNHLLNHLATLLGQIIGTIDPIATHDQHKEAQEARDLSSISLMVLHLPR